MTWWMLTGFGVLGAVIGSFLNVCADRLPAGQSIASPPSHCPHCQRSLTASELIPVVSFLALRGRCRTCGAKIPWRVPVIEAVTGLLFALIAWRFGLDLMTLWVTLYACFLIVMALTDLESQRILNAVVFPAIGLALIAAPFTPGRTVISLILGGLLAFVTLFLLAVLVPGGMGMGDVKLAAFIGLIVGFPQIAFVLLLAFVLGGAVGGALLLSRRLHRGDRIPFGPFLTLASLVGLLYGTNLLQWWIARLA